MKLGGSSDFFFLLLDSYLRLLLSQEGNFAFSGCTGAARKDITHVIEHREQKQNTDGSTTHNDGQKGHRRGLPLRTAEELKASDFDCAVSACCGAAVLFCSIEIAKHPSFSFGWSWCVVNFVQTMKLICKKLISVLLCWNQSKGSSRKVSEPGRRGKRSRNGKDVGVNLTNTHTETQERTSKKKVVCSVHGTGPRAPGGTYLHRPRCRSVNGWHHNSRRAGCLPQLLSQVHHYADSSTLGSETK